MGLMLAKAHVLDTVLLRRDWYVFRLFCDLGPALAERSSHYL